MTADFDLPPAADRPELSPEQIDLSFAAARLASAVWRRLDDELLVVDPRNGKIHVLNSSAAVVWHCLDGTASLAEIAGELAEAFGVVDDAMRADVLAVTRQLGARELLEGVSSRPVSAEPVASRLEPGALVGPVAGYRGDGSPVTLPPPEATGTLLINWSPFCGYCGAIAEQLGALRPRLESAGVELVLLTVGSPSDNASMLGPAGLSDTAAYRRPPLEPRSTGELSGSGAGASPPVPLDPFALIGTPAAYLLDEHGRLVTPLVSGANEVPSLARRVAGLSSGPEGISNSLPAASGMCAPVLGAPSLPGAASRSRSWTRTLRVDLGVLQVGVRVDSDATEELMRRALGARALSDEAAMPANFSVVLGNPPRTPRHEVRSATALSLLLVGDRTVLRSRSPRRVLEALNAHLAALSVQPESSLLRTTNIAGVAGGKAILFPSVTARRLELVQSRLARLGVALSDAAEVLVDASTDELVVPLPADVLARDVLDELAQLPPTTSELPSVAPGRYRIAAWILDQDGPTSAAPTGNRSPGDGSPGDRPLTLAQAVAGALPAVCTDAENLDQAVNLLAQAVDQLAGVFGAVRPVVLASYERDAFAAAVERVVTTL